MAQTRLKFYGRETLQERKQRPYVPTPAFQILGRIKDHGPMTLPQLERWCAGSCVCADYMVRKYVKRYILRKRLGMMSSDKLVITTDGMEVVT